MIETIISLPLLAKAAPILIPVAATLAKHCLGEDKSLFKELLETFIDEAADNTKDRLEEALKKKPDVALAINEQVFMRYTGWALGELIRQFATKPQFEENEAELKRFADQAPDGWITFVQKGSPGILPVQQDVFLRQMAECMARDGTLPPVSSAPFITFINWHVRLPKEMQQKLDTYLKQNLDNALHALLLDDNKEALRAYKQIILTGVHEIQKILHHIQEQLRQHGEGIDDLRDSPGFDLLHYAEKLVLHCERIPFSAKAEYKGVAPIKLSTVFVEPTLRAYPELDPDCLAANRDIANAVRDGIIDELTVEQQQIARRLEEKQIHSTSQPAFQTLYQSKETGHIILAHAGVGKSSLIRRMALRWALQIRQSSDESPETLPLVIELKTYANAYTRDPSLSLLSFLHSCEESIDRLDRVWCLHYLRTGAALLILDGLDEVGKRETRSAIANGASRLLRLGVRVIVTSRREGFITEHWQHQTATWTGWLLEEFSHEQRSMFIKLILPRLYASDGEWKKKQLELQRRFEEQPAIGQLSTNPLLLTLITVLLRTGHLGDNRIALYKEAAELLLDHWEAEHFGADHLPLNVGVPCDADTRREIVRRLALKIVGEDKEGGHCLAENLFGLDILKEAIREVVDPYNIDRGSANMAANLLPNYLNERHSVICYSGQDAESGERLFSFIHRTFLEYFIALAWVEEIDDESATNTEHCSRFLLEKGTDGIPNWRSDRMANILPFYFSLLTDKFRHHRLPLLWNLVVPDETDISLRHESVLFATQVWTEITGRDRKHAEFGAQLRKQLKDVMCWHEPARQGIRGEQTSLFNRQHCSLAAKAWVQFFGFQPDLRKEMFTLIEDQSQTHYLRRKLLQLLSTMTDHAEEISLQLHRFSIISPLHPQLRNAAFCTLGVLFGKEGVLRSLEQLAKEDHIKILDLSFCTALEQLPDLSNFIYLEKLHLTRCLNLKGENAFKHLSNLPTLKSLYLSGCTGLESLTSLSALRDLKTLYLSRCTNLATTDSFGELAKMESLQFLNLAGCTGLTQLSVITDLQNLEMLNLSHCTNLETATFSTLPKLKALRSLTLSGCTSLESLPDLTSLHNLRTLNLDSCSGLKGFHAFTELSKLKELKNLTLSDCTGLERLPDFGDFKNLEWLDLDGCTGITNPEDFISFSKLKSLKNLFISGCTGIDSDTLKQIQKALGPQCKIH